MRQKFIFVTAVSVCLALVLAPAMANERTVDRTSDRTKAGKARGADEPTDVEQSPMLQFIPPLNLSSNLKVSRAGIAKAADLLAFAGKQDADDATVTLYRILRMDLPESAETDKILAETYSRLGDMYDGAPRAQKQVLLYGMALQYSPDPGMRSRLESRITELGGDVSAISFGEDNRPGADVSTRDAGPDDTCPGAIATGLGVGAPYSEVMSITPVEDRNWRSFTHSSRDGWAVRIETISDNPGTFEDDTEVRLWNDCPENGGEIIAANDNKGTGGQCPEGAFCVGSLIQTDCTLTPGNFYVEVGGFFDTQTPDNFTLEIEVTDTCYIPLSDDFEPDDDRAQASEIGHPTSTPPHSLGWGRAKRDIQAHTVAPAKDRDHVLLKLTRDELVRMSTKAQHPTFFNNFTEAESNPDTVLELLYANEADYGGRCNQPNDEFLPYCRTAADCPDPLNNPLPGFPACIPLYLLSESIEFENPLAVNDDRGGGDVGSELLLCLPRTNGQGTTLVDGGDWLVRVSPFSASDTFDYEVQVKNEVSCLYEGENNGCLGSSASCSPTPFAFGTEVHGIIEYSATAPFGDNDVYSWDVAEERLVIFETLSPDPFTADTVVDLYVGPDDFGGFYYTGISNDDGGTGRLSRLEVELGPASALLGNTVADANYLLNVRQFATQPNFPYTLVGTASELNPIETEPNDFCDEANPMQVGDKYIASIDPACDYDSFKFTLTDATFIELSTGPDVVDTTMRLYDCADDSVIQCDEDGGPIYTSLLYGCLPAGDYCAQVRAWSQADTFDYEIELTGTPGCVPSDPPDIVGDNAPNMCGVFDDCRD